MSGFLITHAADADLEEIWQYVALHGGVVRADALEEQVHGAMQRIGEFPGMGFVRSDLADEAVRILSVGHLLIVYRAEARPVEILRVLHGARDVQSILNGNPGLASQGDLEAETS